MKSTIETYKDGICIATETIDIDPEAVKRMAQAALTKSDTTVIRCGEKNISVPDEWASYRAALRSIIDTGVADAIPDRPTYPAGT